MLCFSDLEPGGYGPRRISEREIQESFRDGWSINYIGRGLWSRTRARDPVPGSRRYRKNETCFTGSLAPCRDRSRLSHEPTETLSPVPNLQRNGRWIAFFSPCRDYSDSIRGHDVPSLFQKTLDRIPVSHRKYQLSLLPSAYHLQPSPSSGYHTLLSPNYIGNPNNLSNTKEAGIFHVTSYSSLFAGVTYVIPPFLRYVSDATLFEPCFL